MNDQDKSRPLITMGDTALAINIVVGVTACVLAFVAWILASVFWPVATPVIMVVIALLLVGSAIAERRGRILRCIGAGVVTLLAVIGCSVAADDAPHAQDYSVLKVDDTSFAGRKRCQAFIHAPTATDRAQFTDTLRAAAREIHRSRGDSVVQVFLFANADQTGGRGNLLYIPDRGGLSGSDTSAVWKFTGVPAQADGSGRSSWEE